MNSIWDTIGTILATGIVIYGGYFLRDFLQGKRETKKQELEREREVRDARRRYRESVAIPIREALAGLKASLRGRSFLENVLKEMPNEEKKDLDLLKIKALEPLKEFIERSETVDSLNMFVKVEPLISTITKQDTREFLQKVFLLFGGLNKQQREEQGITEKDIEDDINSAYQKLEDYVAQAD